MGDLKYLNLYIKISWGLRKHKIKRRRQGTFYIVGEYEWLSVVKYEWDVITDGEYLKSCAQTVSTFQSQLIADLSK
jgi:hypothetical protein